MKEFLILKSLIEFDRPVKTMTLDEQIECHVKKQFIHSLIFNNVIKEITKDEIEQDTMYIKFLDGYTKHVENYRYFVMVD